MSSGIDSLRSLPAESEKPIQWRLENTARFPREGRGLERDGEETKDEDEDEGASATQAVRMLESLLSSRWQRRCREEPNVQVLT